LRLDGRCPPVPGPGHRARARRVQGRARRACPQGLPGLPQLRATPCSSSRTSAPGLRPAGASAAPVHPAGRPGIEPVFVQAIKRESVCLLLPDAPPHFSGRSRNYSRCNGECGRRRGIDVWHLKPARIVNRASRRLKVWNLPPLLGRQYQLIGTRTPRSVGGGKHPEIKGPVQAEMGSPVSLQLPT